MKSVAWEPERNRGGNVYAATLDRIATALDLDYEELAAGFARRHSPSCWSI